MRLSAPLLVGFVAYAGCAHQPQSGQWNTASSQMCVGRSCYHVGPLGPSWRVVHTEGGEVGFYNAAIGGVIQANVSCRDDGNAASLRTLTDHLLIGYTERRVIEERLVPLVRREALRTIVEAKLDGVPLTLDLYVLKRDGCVFDLSFAAPVRRYRDGASDFDRFIDGFSDQRTSLTSAALP